MEREIVPVAVESPAAAMVAAVVVELEVPMVVAVVAVGKLAVESRVTAKRLLSTGLEPLPVPEL